MCVAITKGVLMQNYKSLILAVFLLLILSVGCASQELDEIPYPTENMTTVKTVVHATHVEFLEGGGCVVTVVEYGDQFGLQSDWEYKPKRFGPDSSDAQFCYQALDSGIFSAIVTRALPDELGKLEDLINPVFEFPVERVPNYDPPKGY